MLTSIGMILNGSPPRTDRIPVRRGSHLAGRCEGTFWRATCRQEVRRIILAARCYEYNCNSPKTSHYRPESFMAFPGFLTEGPGNLMGAPESFTVG